MRSLVEDFDRGVDPTRATVTAAPVIAPAIYGPGSYSYTVATPGRYTVRIWGGGGSGIGGQSGSLYYGSGAGAGGFSRKTVKLAAGDVISITVGGGGILTSLLGSATGGQSSATCTGKLSMTANGGVEGGAATNTASTVGGGAGGTASGGDVNITGGTGGARNGTSPGAPTAPVSDNSGTIGGNDGTTPGGGAAAGDSMCRGGNGATSGTARAQTPGGGGSGRAESNERFTHFGGDGLCIISYVGA